jgi:hypothetical protein
MAFNEMTLATVWGSGNAHAAKIFLIQYDDFGQPVANPNYVWDYGTSMSGKYSNCEKMKPMINDGCGVRGFGRQTSQVTKLNTWTGAGGYNGHAPIHGLWWTFTGGNVYTNTLKQHRKYPSAVNDFYFHVNGLVGNVWVIDFFGDNTIWANNGLEITELSYEHTRKMFVGGGGVATLVNGMALLNTVSDNAIPQRKRHAGLYPVVVPGLVETAADADVVRVAATHKGKVELKKVGDIYFKTGSEKCVRCATSDDIEPDRHCCPFCTEDKDSIIPLKWSDAFCCYACPDGAASKEGVVCCTIDASVPEFSE